MENHIYTVLIADDEVELIDALELYFKKENLRLIKAHDGDEALALFNEHRPDLLLLDVMMPGMDGFAVLEEIRRTSRVPAIMLTALDTSDDKIRGLQLGADDYITKPYEPPEVVARVKAQLRRSYRYSDEMNQTREKPILSDGDLVLDPNLVRVTHAGEELSLSATEFKILELLMSSPGKIFTKKQIYEAAWEGEFIKDDNTIMVRISNIRKKLGENPKSPSSCIVTVKGLGYKFEPTGQEKTDL